MIDASNVFIIPTVVGLVLAAFPYRMFRRDNISPKYFAISPLVSFTLVFSFFIFSIIGAIREFFSVVYTFVFLFGIAIMGIVALLVYLIVLVVNLRQEISYLWQEIALAQEGRYVEERGGYVDDMSENGQHSVDQ